jgi:hypothetical protein
LAIFIHKFQNKILTDTINGAYNNKEEYTPTGNQYWNYKVAHVIDHYVRYQKGHYDTENRKYCLGIVFSQIDGDIPQ